MLSDLADVRLRLAEARIRVRDLTEEVRVEQARAETLAIEQAGGAKGLGANAEDRTRALTVALASDASYQEIRRDLALTNADVDRLAIELEILLDTRRAREWEIREKLVDALNGRGVQVEPAVGDAPSGFDEAMEWHSDEELDRCVVELPF